MFHLMVVEDDENTLKWMEKVLVRGGYEVSCAENADEAGLILEKTGIDLIILDCMLPGTDGYDFTQQLRSEGSNIPILMVTARDLPEYRYKGFISGTDDYMIKPVDENEMLLRIKALLRRSGTASEKVIKIGDIVIDYDTHSVTMDGETSTLPAKEFLLLYTLLSYPGRIFTRIQLMDEIWGMDSNSLDSTINVHINRLRRRFEGRKEFDIVAIRGVGYKAVKNV